MIGVVILASAGLSIFLSIIIYYLWSLVNGLQLTTLTPLFKVRLPSNVLKFMVKLIKIATFDILQTEKIYNGVFKFSETDSKSDIFDYAGY